MMTRNRRGNFDKFDAQDMAIDTFRKFATEKNVRENFPLPVVSDLIIQLKCTNVSSL